MQGIVLLELQLKIKNEIKKFENNYKDQIMKFAAMQENEVDRWCFYNLKSRGAIK